MIRSLVAMSVTVIVWVSTGHLVALVFVFAALGWFLVEWLADDDPEPLAPYKFPGGDR